MADSLYPRILNLEPWLAHRSVFLIGPRQTGKSTWLRHTCSDARYIDLLDHETFRALSARPERLRELIDPGQRVIIDEVQKLPAMLDEIQRQIDLHDTRFILTGSSARKLRRGQANLLGGRALFFHLHPLTTAEVGVDRIQDLLTRGGLPGIIDSPIGWDLLVAYVGIYLREEVQAEALTRSIGAFTRFLDVAAHFNAEQINYTKIGSDAEVPARTIRDYVRILDDTLLLHTLPAFKGRRRKTAATEKIYFFDIGVAHALAGRKELAPGTREFGKAFEHLVYLELKAARDYRRLDAELTYWRTQTGLEVDFMLNDSVAIEVKGTGKVTSQDCKSLLALDEELGLKRKIIVCAEPERRRLENGIEVLPIAEFCNELWRENLAA